MGKISKRRLQSRKIGIVAKSTLAASAAAADEDDDDEEEEKEERLTSPKGVKWSM